MKVETQVQAAAGQASAKTASKSSARTDASSLVSVNSPILKDVRVALDAKLGRASISVQDLLALKSGSVVKLERKMNELVELRLNDSLVARGEVVAVDDNFGIRIVEISELS